MMSVEIDPADLLDINASLQGKTPLEIIRWAVGLQQTCMTSTSFSQNSAVMLHLVTTVDPKMPIIWADSGYNMPDAYRVAEQLIRDLNLNMHVYSPKMTSERREAVMGGIPHPDDNPELFAEFVRQVKLEPFQKAIDDLRPQVWLTGIRREETEFRKNLDIVTFDRRGILKVAPIFDWTEQDIANYMSQHNLPTCQHYFDPTKLDEKSECGLHTSA